MSNVIDIFAHVRSTNGQQPSPESVDVTHLAWMPMHEIRQKTAAAGPSGRRALAQVFRWVARALVFAQYAEPGEAGVYRAIGTEKALRRAVDFLDLADELEADPEPASSGDA